MNHDASTCNLLGSVRKTAPALAPLFEARSVAVVGASDNPARIGGRPIAYMKAMGFSGVLYPVNPKRTEVQGLRAYPDLADLPGPVDLVVIATPADAVESTLRTAARIGACGAVVFSSGFSESGAAGAERQLRLQAIAKEGGVALIGPNCLGLFDPHTGVAASFTTALEGGAVAPGALACISQSGAMAAYWLDMVRNASIGVSRWISTGNEADVDVAAALEFMAHDERTRVICLYIEDIKDGARFRAAAIAAREAGKALIAIKAGRSEAGAKAAASHTGALAGKPEVYDAFLRQFGVIVVRSLTEMVQVAEILLNRQVPMGDRLGIMSVSGGAGVMLADEAAAAGFSVPLLSPDTGAALASVLPEFAAAQNPIDLTGSIVQHPEGLGTALRIVAGAPEIDALVLFIGLMHSIADPLADAMIALPSEIARRVIVVWMGAPTHAEQRLTAAGLTVFNDIPEAIAALSAARAPLRSPLRGRMPHRETAPSQLAQFKTLSEHAAKALLSRLGGVSVPAGRLVRSAADLTALPNNGPWAAKLQSSQMTHKTEHGAVRLGIRDHGSLAQAVDDLLAIAARLEVGTDGVLIEPMQSGVAELLVGLRRDPQFGPFLVLGRGGTAVELEPDTRLAFLPLSDDEIVAILQSLRCAPLFSGFRGQQPVDLTTTATAIGNLARAFTNAPEVAEIEINPLALPAVNSKAGTTPVALDALAVVRT